MQYILELKIIRLDATSSLFFLITNLKINVDKYLM